MKKIENKSVLAKGWNLLKIVTVFLISVILLMNLWLLCSKYIQGEDLPSIFGYKTAVVLSGSMDPTFSAGDILLYHEEETYEIDDVVIFACDGYYVTHRIIGTEGEYFMTKGDANDVADMELLDPSDIEGKMIAIIPSMGSYVNILNTPFGILIIVLLGAVVFEVPKIFEREK